MSEVAMLQQQPAGVRFRMADHWPRKVWLTRTYLPRAIQCGGGGG